jgi:hypothetical protein
MSLLATPTFAGVAESETFYVRQSAPNVSGVSSVQGIAGAVGITSSDSSITVSVAGQNVNLATTGNALAPSTVSASGAITTGTTITATGAVSGASFSNSTAGTVSFTTPSYPFPTPPVDTTQIFSGNLQALTSTTFSVSALSNYKSLNVSFSGGQVNNTATGGGTAAFSFYLCGLGAVPAVGAAISTNVYVPLVLTSQFSDLRMSTSATLNLNTTPANANNQSQLRSVVIPYPSSGSLTIWNFCSQGAATTWLSALTITVVGIL